MPFDPKPFLKQLTQRPGIYQMFGEKGDVLYVGKAKNLRKRVSSYFRSTGLAPKTQALVSRIANIDVTVTQTEIEAAAFRRLLAHLDGRKDVQNIDLMNLAGFCRNCLSKWYAAAALEKGVEIDKEQAREIVYGMPYSEWKKYYWI